MVSMRPVAMSWVRSLATFYIALLALRALARRPRKHGAGSRRLAS
jgi:hypothetical protein